jgi:hypothetical protein
MVREKQAVKAHLITVFDRMHLIEAAVNAKPNTISGIYQP